MSKGLYIILGKYKTPVKIQVVKLTGSVGMIITWVFHCQYKCPHVLFVCFVFVLNSNLVKALLAHIILGEGNDR